MNESQKKFKLIAIYGKSGSGKDTILNEVVNGYPFHKVVLNTTRPMREGEKEGVSYYYNTINDFTDLILSGKMIVAKKYRDWYYGICEDAFSTEQVNVGCFSPEELKDLIEDERFDIIVVRIDANDSKRLMRSINRTPHMCEEICRRFLQDNEDFNIAQSYIIPDVVYRNDTDDMTNVTSIARDIIGLRPGLGNFTN